MAKKKEKRRSLLDKIRGLETETHPQGKRVGQLFQAVAAGEIEVSRILLFLEVYMLFIMNDKCCWKSQLLADLRGGGAKDPPGQILSFNAMIFRKKWPK